MVTVAIHQPNFLPYLGFFHKLARADVFVMYYTAQFSKNEYHNRNRIKTPRGPQWLTVPVRGHRRTVLRDVEIARGKDWADRHRRTLEANYARARAYGTYADELNRILGKRWTRLVELNLSLLAVVARWLSLGTRVVRASTLAAPGSEDPTEAILQMTRQCGGTTYLSGPGGRRYLRADAFQDVHLEYDAFVARPYRQLFGDFVPNLSVVDALFNLGEQARELIDEPRTPV